MGLSKNATQTIVDAVKTAEQRVIRAEGERVARELRELVTNSEAMHVEDLIDEVCAFAESLESAAHD